MDHVMRQKRISITDKARAANGRSHACERCNHFPCPPSLIRLCSEAFTEGFKKGYECHRKEQKQ